MIAASSSAIDALKSTLDGEYAAVYAYGLIGSQLSGSEQLRARRALNTHRGSRDQLRAQIAATGEQPPDPSPAYQTPQAVTSSATATALAVVVEQRLVRSWSALAAATSGDDRKSAARAASESAVRAISWGSVSQAFPG
ncbi:MAG: ferritin-like domain-containing protein [Candidatus Nanopelagicales bacterium]